MSSDTLLRLVRALEVPEQATPEVLGIDDFALRIGTVQLEGDVMSDPIFRYCPLCATALIEKEVAHVRRSVCPACTFILFLGLKVVVVVVVRQRDRLLLGKRNIEPGKGLWNFCGGYVELGETVEEAAIREVKEEANLDVELESLVGIYSEGAGSHVVIAYQASIHSRQVRSIVAQ